MDIDKEKNKIVLEQIFFHLDEAMRLCNQLDLSGLSSIDQGIWDTTMKICKDALHFTKESTQRLSKILSL